MDKDSQQAQQAMFGMPQQQKPKAEGAVSLGEISNQLINLSRRLRILEERYSNLHKKTTVTDNNMLQHFQEAATSIQVLGGDITEGRKELLGVQDKMRLMIRELKNCATSEEVKILQNYLNFWEPMEFVTRNEVAKIVKEQVDEAIEAIARQSFAQQPREDAVKKKPLKTPYHSE